MKYSKKIYNLKGKSLEESIKILLSQVNLIQEETERSFGTSDKNSANSNLSVGEQLSTLTGQIATLSTSVAELADRVTTLEEESNT